MRNLSTLPVQFPWIDLPSDHWAANWHCTYCGGKDFATLQADAANADAFLCKNCTWSYNQSVNSGARGTTKAISINV